MYDMIGHDVQKNSHNEGMLTDYQSRYLFTGVFILSLLNKFNSREIDVHIGNDENCNIVGPSSYNFSSLMLGKVIR